MRSETKAFLAVAIAIASIAALVILYVPLEAQVQSPPSGTLSQLTFPDTGTKHIAPSISGDYVVYVRQPNTNTASWRLVLHHLPTNTSTAISTLPPLYEYYPPRINGNMVIWTRDLDVITVYNITSAATAVLTTGTNMLAYTVEGDWAAYTEQGTPDKLYAHHIPTDTRRVVHTYSPDSFVHSIAVHNGVLAWGDLANLHYTELANPLAPVQTLNLATQGITKIVDVDVYNGHVVFNNAANFTLYTKHIKLSVGTVHDAGLRGFGGLPRFHNNYMVGTYLAGFMNVTVGMYNVVSDEYYLTPLNQTPHGRGLSVYGEGLNTKAIIAAPLNGETIKLYLWDATDQPPATDGDTGSIGDADQPPPFQSWMWIVIAVAVIITALGIAAWQWGKRPKEPAQAEPPEAAYGTPYRPRGKRG